MQPVVACEQRKYKRETSVTVMTKSRRVFRGVF